MVGTAAKVVFPAMIFRLILTAVFFSIGGVCLFRKDIALNGLQHWRQIKLTAEWTQASHIIAVMSITFGGIILLRSVWFAIALYSFAFAVLSFGLKDILWQLIAKIAVFFGERWYKPSDWDKSIHLIGRVLMGVCVVMLILDTLF